jgi:hypothetical protein
MNDDRGMIKKHYGDSSWVLLESPFLPIHEDWVKLACTPYLEILITYDQIETRGQV